MPRLPTHLVQELNVDAVCNTYIRIYIYPTCMNGSQVPLSHLYADIPSSAGIGQVYCTHM